MTLSGSKSCTSSFDRLSRKNSVSFTACCSRFSLFCSPYDKFHIHYLTAENFVYYSNEVTVTSAGRIYNNISSSNAFNNADYIKTSIYTKQKLHHFIFVKSEL